MRNLLMTGTARSAGTRRSLTLLGALILLALAGWAAVASGGPSVATPRITSGPADATSGASATFAFTAGARGDTTECSLDRAAYAACTSPKGYGRLADGTHAFRVRERNPRLGAGDPATRTWTVDTVGNRSGATAATWSVAAAASGLPFTLSGGYGRLLYPGKAATLALRVANPDGVPLVVTSLTVTIEPGSSKAGCDGPANLSVAQSSVSAANPLTVPAHGSVTLPSSHVSAPRVTMRDLPTSQDACKGAVFSFAYGVSAHA